MSMIYSIDIQCDGCTKWHEGKAGPRTNASEIRKAYKALGWTTKYDGSGVAKDYCEKCSEKNARKRAKEHGNG